MNMYYNLPTLHAFCVHVYNITRLWYATPLKAVSSSCAGEMSDSCIHNATPLVLERLRVAASNYNEQQFIRCSC